MKFEERATGFLIGYLARKNHAYFEHEFSKMGLTPGAPFILKQLYHNDGIRQQDISDNQHINKAHITRILPRLIEQGLIRREAHPTDKRAYRIFLTQKAKDMREDFFRTFHVWEALLNTNFTVEETAALRNALLKMVDNIETYGAQKEHEQ